MIYIIFNRKNANYICKRGVLNPWKNYMWCSTRLYSRPLLFLIYINDMDICLQHCSADVYADGTTFYVNAKSIAELNEKLGEDMKRISSWCINNRMVINTSKTKAMLIGSRQKLSALENDKELSVVVNAVSLQNVSCEKLLGIMIDNHLTWNDQIDHICSVINNRLALLRRIKPYTDISTQILFYNGYVLPIFDYCSTVWGSSSVGNFSRLQRLQKMAARIILNASFENRSSELFKALNWKSIDVLLRSKRLCMVYKALNGLTPQYITDMFRFSAEVHQRALRSTSNNNIFLTGGRTEYHNRKFSCIAAKEWNQLPNECKSAMSLPVFKRLLKSVL